MTTIPLFNNCPIKKQFLSDTAELFSIKYMKTVLKQFLIYQWNKILLFDCAGDKVGHMQTFEHQCHISRDIC